LDQWVHEHISPSLVASAAPANSIIAEVADSFLDRSTKYTVITDTQSSLVISARKKDEPDQMLELDIVKVARHDHGLSLCLFLAAYTYASVLREYISRGEQALPYHAHGAPNNPAIPLPSDAEVFTTRKCRSDFDRYALENDRSQAEQFFRWQERLGDDSVSNTLAAGDILTAMTNELFKRHVPLRPRYPLDSLPALTSEFLNVNRRSTFDSLVATALNQSQRFSLEITRILHVGQSKTVVGRVIYVDATPVPASSEICIKLFDSSLLNKLSPKKSIECSFFNFETCEDAVKREDAAYRRLEHAQGSVVPFYYGSHLVSGPRARKFQIRSLPKADRL
jgi:hypothetical protein